LSAPDDEAAEAYYETARRRLGCLGTSLIDIQCFYYAALFERFAFRPLQAWVNLQQAATRLRLHHMGGHGARNRLPMGVSEDYDTEPDPWAVSYHFEQRAFWSIHKGEKYVDTAKP